MHFNLLYTIYIFILILQILLILILFWMIKCLNLLLLHIYMCDFSLFSLLF